MITRTQVDESKAAANSAELTYIEEKSEYEVGDQVILFKNKLIGDKLTETIVGQVVIHSIAYEQFETKEPNGFRFEFVRSSPDNQLKEITSIDFDRMQLASEFLEEFRNSEYEIPTSEGVANQKESQDAEG